MRDLSGTPLGAARRCPAPWESRARRRHKRAKFEKNSRLYLRADGARQAMTNGPPPRPASEAPSAVRPQSTQIRAIGLHLGSRTNLAPSHPTLYPRAVHADSHLP